MGDLEWTPADMGHESISQAVSRAAASLEKGLVEEEDAAMSPTVTPVAPPDSLEDEEEEEEEDKEELKEDELRGHSEAIERLKQVLPEWVEDVPLMVKRHPRLVRADPKTLGDRLEKLRELLPMGTEELAKIVRAQPSLVNHSPEALASTVGQLKSLVPSEVDVGYLLSSRPILLKQSAKTLAANWKSLRDHAALVPRWQQELDLFSRRRSTALGNLLLYGRKKHGRLARVAALAPVHRDRYALSTIFNMKDDAFEDKFDPEKLAHLESSKPPRDDTAPETVVNAIPPPVEEPPSPKRQKLDDPRGEDAAAASFEASLGEPVRVEPPAVNEKKKTTKRPRGSREPFCPKCANPKCHKSHTYVAPCVREGQVKPVRAKPKSHVGKSLAKRAPAPAPLADDPPPAPVLVLDQPPPDQGEPPPVPDWTDANTAVV
ncbi:hypothetical protein CTAYLR_008331 [Chrysophaeum taylorii]|uniref:Uncharacterized protein n=1 Tax=Chrysophaeum taylorii TaxID=2483200 RepID=A0AAD7UDH1_9STRA|nr:hypothetical protein CTAYLR_008331 [Chrysophaeum taylorii]